jgi:hypothetical protein
MQTLIFFDRGGLSVLFSKLTIVLKSNYHIIHVAYSKSEKKYLEKEGVDCNYVLQDYLETQYPDIVIDDNKLRIIDENIINYTNGRFTLNSSIQSDRTCIGIDYGHALKMVLLYYEFWENIYSANNISFSFHEPTSLLMNHMACIIGKKYGSIYAYFLHADNCYDKYSFSICNYDDGSNIEFESIYNQITDNDILYCSETIDQYLTTFKRSYDHIVNSKLFAKERPWKLLLLGLVAKYFKKSNVDNDGCNLLDVYLKKQNSTYRLKKWHNMRQYKKIHFSDPSETDNYYYYSMHLEPEAVVLYWGDGIYAGQVKLIENIAAQLPAGTYLYVKDHPHIIGYRDPADYKKLQSIPNIKLIRSKISGKLLIRNAIGVFSINGTANLEAAILGIESYIFGNRYYTLYNGVTKVDNIKDLSSILREKKTVVNNTEYRRFILAHIKSMHKGYADFTGGEKRLRSHPESTSSENINDIARVLKQYINQFAK